MKHTLSVVIPFYNEERTIAVLLDKVVSAPLPSGTEMEIIPVNDGSTDDSPRIVRNWIEAHQGTPERSFRFTEKTNGGKGSAVREGIRVSTGDLLIIQDADLEYDPNDYTVCIEPILRGECSIVYGSREDSNRNRIYSSPTFYLGGLSLTFLIDLLCNADLTDEPTCYKTFDGNLIRHVPFEGNCFEWEPEITVKLLRLGFEIREVLISYHPRSIEEGKKIRWHDGLEGILTALKWRFKPIGRIQKNVAELPESQSRIVRKRKRSSIVFYLLPILCFFLHACFTGHSFNGGGIFSALSPLILYPMLKQMKFPETAAAVTTLLLSAPAGIGLTIFGDDRITGGIFLLLIALFFFIRFFRSGFSLFLLSAVFFTGVATLFHPGAAFALLPELLILWSMKRLPIRIRVDYTAFSLPVFALTQAVRLFL